MYHTPNLRGYLISCICFIPNLNQFLTSHTKTISALHTFTNEQPLLLDHVALCEYLMISTDDSITFFTSILFVDNTSIMTGNGDEIAWYMPGPSRWLIFDV